MKLQNCRPHLLGAIFIATALCPSIAVAQSDAIRWRAADCQLTISQVSDRTLHISVAPRVEGEPIAAPPSAVVVDLDEQVQFSESTIPDTSELEIGDLRLEIHNQPLSIAIRRASGELVQKLTFDGDDGSMSFRAEAPVLGMGEGAKQFDRRGAQYTMKDGWGAWERPVLGSWVATPFLIGTDGWALLVHHPQGEFDLREAEASFKPWDDQTDLPLEVYVVAWDEPADVLEEYVRLCGRTPLPPKWTMGYMQSHRTLAGPDEVMEVARTFREKQLPCDALIYLGTGYCPAGWNTGHSSLDFNPETFDKPAEMIDELHDMHFRVVLHKNAPPQVITGDEVESYDGAPRRRRRRSDISEYWARHKETFALGVDGWWPDDGDPLSRESRIARHRMYHLGPLLDRPNVRPWSLHRTGYAGASRYGGWIWSGDIDGRWRTLAAQVAVGQNHSLSLTPYWGTDIGGFYPSRELNGELYVRWFQFGTFCASMRAHGRTWHLRLPWAWNQGEYGPKEHPENPPESELHNAEVEPICHKYLALRYQLLPYNYTLCREAHDTGLPLTRALWLHYPDDAVAVLRGDEYLWGRDMLVAPVVERGVTERDVYLPEGDWYDYWTGELQSGGREITRQVDLETLPLYVRTGAIVPHAPVRQYTAQPVDEPTTLRVYTGRDGEFRWYEDDGGSLEYLDGNFTWTRLAWNDADKQLTIEPDDETGSAETPGRELVVELVPSGEKKTVRYEGAQVQVRF